MRETSSRARETRKKKTKEKERFRHLPALSLVAAVDVEHFGYCMYAHRIFFCVLSILLLASMLLARCREQVHGEREKRE